MPRLVQATRLSLLFFVIAATGSCYHDITSVCAQSLDGASYQDPAVAKFMDGVWVLKSVNEQPIPATGFPLPKSGDRLKAGHLEFNSHFTDACTAPSKSTGDVVATYLLADNAGRAKFPSRAQGGRFEFSHKTNEVTLGALGHSVVGHRSGSSATASLFVLANIGDDGPYGLLFQR